MSVVNPLRAIRLDRKYSLDRMANEAGVSRQLVIRAEQAVYHDPPPALLEAILRIVDEDSPWVDEPVLVASYHSFQVTTRKANYGRLNPFFNFMAFRESEHPWVNWRIRSGVMARIGPAKLYCVHPAILHKFEVQPHLVQTVPGDLKIALSQAGYAKEVLDALDQAYYRYKQTRKIQAGILRIEEEVL